jgi:hypothetical protein
MEVFTNPWVITIGGGIVVGLILRFAFGIGKRKPKHGQIATTIQQDNHSTPPPKPIESATNDITPQSIMGYWRSLPPLQRDSSAEYYKGISVSWTLNLEYAHTLSGSKLHLMMLSQGEYPWVCCDVNPKEYPLLNVINPTQLFTVEGKIKSVKAGEITLENCRFLF